jgi:hypothetical protein
MSSDGLSVLQGHFVEIFLNRADHLAMGTDAIVEHARPLIFMGQSSNADFFCSCFSQATNPQRLPEPCGFMPSHLRTY